MTIGSVIATYRKNLGLTQDGLAQQLGVTNQAVSKWESDQSCPDILLLPQIADIFGITIDELFGREAPRAEPVAPALPQIVEVTNLPWPDDKTLRVILYAGHTYISSTPEQEKITFEYEGPALNIECAVNLTCNEVNGNVRAGGDVTCDAVNGRVDAGGTVTCDEVMGNVSAGGDVSCNDVAGEARAHGSITCDNVAGNVQAGGTVSCCDVDGNVSAAGCVTCDSVEGDVSAGGDVTCDEVEGNVHAGGNVTCEEVSGSVTAGGTVTTDSDDQGNFHFSMNGNGKKNKHVHITLDDADEEAVEKLENSIEQFVSNIVKKCKDFRF